MPFRREGQNITVSIVPLIFQNFNLTELAPVGSAFTLSGCRGFSGPIPPPLWIRAPFKAFLDFSSALITSYRWKVNFHIKLLQEVKRIKNIVFIKE
jgi:hypothetical protein